MSRALAEDYVRRKPEAQGIIMELIDLQFLPASLFCDPRPIHLVFALENTLVGRLMVSQHIE